jgi:small-conductance mechanosensitive channel
MQNIIIISSVSFTGFVVGGIAGFVFAIMMWFFSTRRSLFLRIFTAYEEDHNEADKNMPKDELFQKVCRGFAVAFLIFAIVFVALAIFS